MSTPVRTALCLILLFVAFGTACAAKMTLRDPMKLDNDETLKAIYFFPHWWDPWKSDDAAISSDIQRMKALGFNTVCLDHEVSQAVDRDWYWLDREYRLAGAEKMRILPWVQLQSVDRVGLMKFSHLQLKAAVDQDGRAEEDCAIYRDGEFRKALAHYASVYLDRYIEDPALLRVKDSRGKVRPVVGLMVETGWRSPGGLPLSFDDETNDYFRKWMRSSHHDLDHLNKKWGTSYKSFDEIDPKDKTIFDYAFEDKGAMPPAVQDHVQFRARLINDAMQEVAKQIRRKHKDVLLLAEIAYPFSADHPDARVYRWNNANVYKAVEWADIVFIRTVGNTSYGDIAKEQDMMILNGKRLILAYRFFEDATPQRAVAFAMDCASSAHGLAYYNWNETADDASAIHDKPDRQEFARLLTSTYEMLFDSNKRHDVPAANADITVDDPGEPAVSTVPSDVVPVEPAPAGLTPPDDPTAEMPASEPLPPVEPTP